jgi:GntR family transcriptional regulator
MVSSLLSTRPLYLQLRDALAARIAMGAWRPGAAIPNEGDLAASSA